MGCIKNLTHPSNVLLLYYNATLYPCNSNTSNIFNILLFTNCLQTNQNKCPDAGMQGYILHFYLTLKVRRVRILCTVRWVRINHLRLFRIKRPDSPHGWLSVRLVINLWFISVPWNKQKGPGEGQVAEVRCRAPSKLAVTSRHFPSLPPPI